MPYGLAYTATPYSSVRLISEKSLTLYSGMLCRYWQYSVNNKVWQLRGTAVESKERLSILVRSGTRPRFLICENTLFGVGVKHRSIRKAWKCSCDFRMRSCMTSNVREREREKLSRVKLRLCHHRVKLCLSQNYIWKVSIHSFIFFSELQKPIHQL